MINPPDEINALFIEHPNFTSAVNSFKKRNYLKVLDLGCNTGTHLVRLLEEGFEAEGIDDSPVDVDTANKRIRDRHLAGEASLADVHEKVTNYSNESFDAVVSINSLQETSLTTFQQTLVEINRMLKPKGLFFLVVPSKEVKINEAYDGQLFFSEDELKPMLFQRFNILEFSKDPQQNFVILAEEK